MISYPFCLDLIMKNTTGQSENEFLECILLFRTKDANVRNTLLTVIYATLIPIIIGANLLLIIGIAKTKQNKLSSSQILFLTLFLSDLTFGVVQLPLQIYLIWKSGDPTCLEIQLSVFSITFPVSMSGNILCMIPVDRYISVAHGINHKKFVTNSSLGIIITLMILISLTWAASTALFSVDFVFYVLTACEGTVFMLGISFNIALLRYVRLKTKTSLIPPTVLNTALTKTIALIVTIMVATYVPLIITLNIVENALMNSTDEEFIEKVVNDLLWALIPSQINPALNSIIYLTRNSRIKRYCYKLFTSGGDERNLLIAMSPKPNSASKENRENSSSTKSSIL